MKRTYAVLYDPRGHSGNDPEWFCQHCEDEKSWLRPVRRDRLRGTICADCDSALDEMFGERAA